MAKMGIKQKLKNTDNFGLWFRGGYLGRPLGFLLFSLIPLIGDPLYQYC